MTNRKTLGCLECGNEITAVQPDDIHIYAFINASDAYDHIAMKVKCETCGHVTTIYWGKQRPIRAFKG